MKLYASVSSERATKGQGGKELMIEVMGEAQEIVARIKVTRPDDIKYFMEVFPVIYPDKLKVDVRGHGYRVKRIDICNFGQCQNEAVKYGVCRKHLALEETKGEKKVYSVINYTNKVERVMFDSLAEAKSFAIQTNGTLETKGEKKKDECTHDWDNYGKCCDCGRWNTQ